MSCKSPLRIFMSYLARGWKSDTAGQAWCHAEACLIYTRYIHTKMQYRCHINCFKHLVILHINSFKYIRVTTTIFIITSTSLWLSRAFSVLSYRCRAYRYMFFVSNRQLFILSSRSQIETQRTATGDAWAAAPHLRLTCREWERQTQDVAQGGQPDEPVQGSQRRLIRKEVRSPTQLLETVSSYSMSLRCAAHMPSYTTAAQGDRLPNAKYEHVVCQQLKKIHARTNTCIYI